MDIQQLRLLRVDEVRSMIGLTGSPAPRVQINGIVLGGANPAGSEVYWFPECESHDYTSEQFSPGHPAQRNGEVAG